MNPETNEEYIVIRNGSLTPNTYEKGGEAIEAASKLAAETGEQTHVVVIMATCTPEPIAEDEDDEGPCTCSLCRKVADPDLPPTPAGYLLFGEGPLDVLAEGRERTDVLFYNPKYPKLGWSRGFLSIGWAGDDDEGGYYTLRAGSAIAAKNGLEAPAGPEETCPEETCPEGYIYYGQGPLKRFASGYELGDNVACWDGCSWDTDSFKGDDDSFHYAVKAGTKLAADNGLEPAPEPSNPMAQSLHAKAAFDELLASLRKVDSPIFQRAAVLASITCLTEYLREVK